MNVSVNPGHLIIGSAVLDQAMNIAHFYKQQAKKDHELTKYNLILEENPLPFRRVADFLTTTINDYPRC